MLAKVNDVIYHSSGELEGLDSHAMIVLIDEDIDSTVSQLFNCLFPEQQN